MSHSGKFINDLPNISGPVATYNIVAQGPEGRTEKISIERLLANFTAPTLESLGIGNINNTSDVNKPISTATRLALATKATLVNGRIPATLFPQELDEVQMFSTLSEFPLVGMDGRIYVDKVGATQFYWDGSTSSYRILSPMDYVGLELGTTETTAYRGDWGHEASQHALVRVGNPHSVSSSDVGLGNVDNTSDAEKPVSAALVNELANKASLDASGMIPVELIPNTREIYRSHNKASLPAVGVEDEIYCTTSDNVLYRWDDHQAEYIELAPLRESPDKNFEFIQTSAEVIWVLTHELDKFPSITAMDDNGFEIGGSVQHVNRTTAVIRFKYPKSGIASCN